MSAHTTATVLRQIDEMDARVKALLDASAATLMFHTSGQLVGLDTLLEWRKLTGERPMTAQGLVDFVRAKLEEAK